MCAGVTTYHALRSSPLRPGDLVAVQGIGGLGHLGIQFAARMGCEVVAISRGTDKADLARKLGAHHHVDARTTDRRRGWPSAAAPRSSSPRRRAARPSRPLVPGLSGRRPAHRGGRRRVAAVGVNAMSLISPGRLARRRGLRPDDGERRALPDGAHHRAVVAAVDDGRPGRCRPGPSVRRRSPARRDRGSEDAPARRAAAASSSCDHRPAVSDPGTGRPREHESPDPQVRVRVVDCRGGGIRTHGLLVPNEARYQAAPHPERRSRWAELYPVDGGPGRPGARDELEQRHLGTAGEARGANGDVPSPAESAATCARPRATPACAAAVDAAVGDDRADAGEPQLAAVGVAGEHEVVAVGGERVEDPGLGGVGEPQAQVDAAVVGGPERPRRRPRGRRGRAAGPAMRS
ncbi:hypothetical protein L7F22_045794 [Adiantum nelumboides]|nr:hypothetical protein [Adiantum nelumboides]